MLLCEPVAGRGSSWTPGFGGLTPLTEKAAERKIMVFLCEIDHQTGRELTCEPGVVLLGGFSPNLSLIPVVLRSVSGDPSVAEGHRKSGRFDRGIALDPYFPWENHGDQVGWQRDGGRAGDESSPARHPLHGNGRNATGRRAWRRSADQRHALAPRHQVRMG